jgi:hypothetical protein
MLAKVLPVLDVQLITAAVKTNGANLIPATHQLPETFSVSTAQTFQGGSDDRSK